MIILFYRVIIFFLLSLIKEETVIMDRHCFECKHYCQLVNQGIWWCRLQKDMEHPDLCDNYEFENHTGIITTTSIE